MDQLCVQFIRQATVFLFKHSLDHYLPCLLWAASLSYFSVYQKFGVPQSTGLLIIALTHSTLGTVLLGWCTYWLYVEFLITANFVFNKGM